MSRFRVRYEVFVVAYCNGNYKSFIIELCEHVWDLLTLRHTKNLLSRSENYDFFKCVKETNDYIIGNKLDKSKITYPEIYQLCKP